MSDHPEHLYSVAELQDGHFRRPLPSVYALSACDAAGQSAGDDCRLLAMRWGDNGEDTFRATVRERDGRVWTVSAWRKVAA